MSAVTTESASRKGYRMRRDEVGKLHKVIVRDGVEGYMERWTSECWGCTDYGDYGTPYGPFGCEECGFRGYRRNEGWSPFDWAEYYVKMDARVAVA